MASGVATLHVDEHRQMIDGEVDHGLFELRLVYRVRMVGRGALCHPFNCHSIVAEDVDLTVTCLTGGVIVAER